MVDIRSKIRDIYSLEQLSSNHTFIHALCPGAKLLTTVCYIVAVTSFNRFALLRLIPYVFYPLIVMALSETPYRIIAKRVLLALPFVLFAGVSNIFFENGSMIKIGGILVTAGVISFFTVIFRTVLTVTSVLVLVAVTPFHSLMNTLRRLHLPQVLIMLIELSYRYISVLLEEASDMYTAYILRHTHTKGLEMKHMGSFIGHLFMKSIDRAERIYAAMRCRGYGRRDLHTCEQKWQSGDYLFVAITVGSFILCRFVNVMRLWEYLL